ncbi:hypothetical protein E2562_029260 [Oryza meyeriana var. granulata]|uniref:KIB1-4 beta-propeller domain-containing protein n=1 Tax=Oryza meyeriana var. granulata TaxID=110450 RepID=A0A6G1ER01_9ORYZ|nr:hypothetical protein E2562_029260 [Oryza meyeriana var. granulata]
MDTFAAKPPLPPQLPFLILPWRKEQLVYPYGVRIPTLFCIVDNQVHPIHKLPRTRCFGSYDGGWLFIANGQKDEHELLNLYTMRSITIPNTATTWDEKTISLTLLAATLSTAPPPMIGPVAPLDLRCAGAAIVSTFPDVTIPSPRIVLWFVGEGEPYYLSAPAYSSYPYVVVDVIYRDGAFRFLTEREYVLEVTTTFDEERRLSAVVEKPVFFEERGRDDDHDVQGRYLVESRGELLMVVRLPSRESPGTTFAFRVFQMQQLNHQQPSHPMATARGAWTTLPDLDGRILFVGRGCSRSYEVADFPGSKEGIYFLDDRDYKRVEMIHSDADYREYSCSENDGAASPGTITINAL